MALLSDETLMAYADGELDAAARARVDAVLERDPESRARLEIFESTGAPLAALYGKPMTEPVPPHLVALVLGGKDRAVATAPGVTRPGRRSVRAMGALLTHLSWPEWALVAACAALILVAGGRAGWYLHKTSDGMRGLVGLERGQIFALGPLKEALETAPSGANVALGDAVTLRPALTFKNRNNAFCRQYDATAPEGAYAGIACRGDDGRWSLELHLSAAPRPKTADRTAPAGASRPADVEAAVANVIEGDALGRADEDALIRNKWRR